MESTHALEMALGAGDKSSSDLPVQRELQVIHVSSYLQSQSALLICTRSGAAKSTPSVKGTPPPTGQQGQQGLARKSKNRVPRNKVTRVHPSTIIMVNLHIPMGKDYQSKGKPSDSYRKRLPIQWQTIRFLSKNHGKSSDSYGKGLPIQW